MMGRRRKRMRHAKKAVLERNASLASLARPYSKRATYRRGISFKSLIALRFAWGVALVVVPDGIIRLESWGRTVKQTEGDGAIAGDPPMGVQPDLTLIARILGARHIAQATATYAIGPRVLWLGSVLDSLHALSGVAFAALDSDNRRLALTDASLACGWAAAGVGVARRSRTKGLMLQIGAMAPSIGKQMGRASRRISAQGDSVRSLSRSGVQQISRFADQAVGPLSELSTFPTAGSDYVRAAVPVVQAKAKAAVPVVQAKAKAAVPVVQAKAKAAVPVVQAKAKSLARRR